MEAVKRRISTLRSESEMTGIPFVELLQMETDRLEFKNSHQLKPQVQRNPEDIEREMFDLMNDVLAERGEEPLREFTPYFAPSDVLKTINTREPLTQQIIEKMFEAHYRSGIEGHKNLMNAIYGDLKTIFKDLTEDEFKKIFIGDESELNSETPNSKAGAALDTLIDSMNEIQSLEVIATDLTFQMDDENLFLLKLERINLKLYLLKNSFDSDSLIDTLEKEGLDHSETISELSERINYMCDYASGLKEAFDLGTKDAHISRMSSLKTEISSLMAISESQQEAHNYGPKSLESLEARLMTLNKIASLHVLKEILSKVSEKDNQKSS